MKPFAHVLTPAQTKVIRAWVSGRSIKEVASHLGKGVKVSEYHLAQAFQRIGMKDKALVTKWAIRNGLTKV